MDRIVRPRAFVYLDTDTNETAYTLNCPVCHILFAIDSEYVDKKTPHIFCPACQTMIELDASDDTISSQGE